MEVLPASDWSKSTEVGANSKKNSETVKKIFKIGRYFSKRCGEMAYTCGDFIQIIEFLQLTAVLFDSYVSFCFFIFSPIPLLLVHLAMILFDMFPKL